MLRYILLSLFLAITPAFGQGVMTTNNYGRLNLATDFGADPTGQTDISTALTKAINSGKPIYIPPGTYLLSGIVTDSNALPVDIQGAGPLATTIHLTGSINISQTGNFTIYFSMRNIGINFDGSGQISLSGTTYNNSQPQQGPLFDNVFFNVLSSYSGAGPALNFATVSAGRIVNSFGLINAVGTSTNPNILTNFIEISGQSMNWEFVGDQFWDNINGSNTSNITNGLYLNGASTNGIQGTRIGNSMFVGFSKGIYIGPNNITVQIENCMLDQNFYPVYINSGSSSTPSTDIRIHNTYMGSSAAASSGSSAVYIGGNGTTTINISQSTAISYNSGNYSIDLTGAVANNVTLLDVNMGSSPINNPNNVPLGTIQTAGPVTVSGLITGSNIANPSVITLGTPTPVSGTAYQWNGPGILQLSCPITMNPTSTAAATAALDIGPTSTPATQIDYQSRPAGITAITGEVVSLHADVPNGWYYEISVTNATIGTCVAVAH